MTNVLANFSNIIIPLLIFYIVAYGVVSDCNVYDAFLKGTKTGIHTVIQICPTLIALMVGVGILRASGFLTFVGNLFGKILNYTSIASEIYSLIIIKMFSSSAATGLLLDIYKTYGTDSPTGFLASLILCSTETIFYTMSIYFTAAKVIKTRFTLPGALLSMISGIIASVIIVHTLFLK